MRRKRGGRNNLTVMQLEGKERKNERINCEAIYKKAGVVESKEDGCE